MPGNQLADMSTEDGADISTEDGVIVALESLEEGISVAFRHSDSTYPRISLIWSLKSLGQDIHHLLQ